MCHACHAPIEGHVPCAVLICASCREMSECHERLTGRRFCTKHSDKQHDSLRLAREAMNRHLAEHKLEYQKTNPYWPFLNWHEAAAYQEAL